MAKIVGTKGLAMNDTRIFTNAPGNTLLARFKSILADNVQFVDILVGYFRISGFNQLYESLRDKEQIRILVGLNLDKQSYTFIDAAKQQETQTEMTLSAEETKQAFVSAFTHEADTTGDEKSLRESHRLFIELLTQKKLIIKAHPSQNIHAKVYIMRFRNPPRSDYGKVITGSSNFSANGFQDQYEFNVELKDESDVRASENIFNQLWAEAVDVTADMISGPKPGVLDDAITPYDVYLKFLTEYFRNHVDTQRLKPIFEINSKFKSLQYQIDAVISAQQMLATYGGVFLADVVGLGKTYMAAMLALQLDGPCLVVAPPALLDDNSAGSWSNVFRALGVSRAKVTSLGKLQETIDQGIADFKYVIVDEAHRFKGDATQRYALLKEICQQKGVILLSATPYNNNPKDILSQLSLFLDPRNSRIPGIPNIEKFFQSLERKLAGVHRINDSARYMQIVRDNAAELRAKVLRYVMVRRTRTEITTYYAEDLRKQDIVFPTVADPISMYYKMTPLESKIFDDTLKVLAPGVLHYARYRTLSEEYYRGPKENISEQGSVNLATFMRILLVKRLESSFFAFQETLKRFIVSYEHMIASYKNGTIYTSRRDSVRLFDAIESGDVDTIDALLADDRAQAYPASDLDPIFLEHLVEDVDQLRDIAARWQTLRRDPKWDAFKHELQTRIIDGVALAHQKLVIFTEYADTAERLAQQIREIEPRTLVYTSKSDDEQRRRVVANFDANSNQPSNEYRIIVTTDVLAEGVNMHQSCVVINYDLPWNPSKLMQRVGRVNRVGTKFTTLYTINFFPSDEGEKQIALADSARAKINAFIHLLGNDARLLSDDEEIISHGFFDDLMSGAQLNPPSEPQSELKYLNFIMHIRDTQPELFARIMQLSRKIFSARTHHPHAAHKSIVSYFRQGELDRFWMSAPGHHPREIDFFVMVAALECAADQARSKLDEEYFFTTLQDHKQSEYQARQQLDESGTSTLSGHESRVISRLQTKQFKAYYQPVADKRAFVQQVINAIKAGRIPAKLITQIANALSKTNDNDEIMSLLQTKISSTFFRTPSSTTATPTGYDGVVLAEYFS